MSLSPANTPQHSPGEGNSSADPAATPAAPARRPARIWTICFVLLALEIGGFLVVFPWMEAWRLNHFRAMFPPLSGIWDDPYFRGAITGLGAVNLLVAIGQAVHLLRSPKHS